MNTERDGVAAIPSGERLLQLGEYGGVVAGLLGLLVNSRRLLVEGIVLGTGSAIAEHVIYRRDRRKE
jgi:hypothetical protein